MGGIEYNNNSITASDWNYNTKLYGTGYTSGLSNYKYNNSYLNLWEGTASNTLGNYSKINYDTTNATTYSDTYVRNVITATQAIWHIDDLARQEGEWFANGKTWKSKPLTPAEQIKQMIRERMAPVIHRGRKREAMTTSFDIREMRARQTLRRVIGEQSFKRFMRDGFITVVPKSGLTYRIYPGHGVTDVYDQGKLVDRLCVVLKGNFPPTDSILMRYLLILNDEGEFSQHAIKHGIHGIGETALKLPDQRALTEVWGELQQVA